MQKRDQEAIESLDSIMEIDRIFAEAAAKARNIPELTSHFSKFRQLIEKICENHFSNKIAGYRERKQVMAPEDFASWVQQQRDLSRG